MLSSKEALEMYHRVACYHNYIVDDSSHYETIKKDLEVLEIIKTKNVNISLIKNGYGPFAYAVYNSYIDIEKNDELTKEEYELLKEWLEE